MSKLKIQVYELAKGMYVSELDRPWEETRFLFQGFRITNDQEIDSLQKNCEFVYVDEDKSTIDLAANLRTIKPSPGGSKIRNILKTLHTINVKHKTHQVQFETEFPQAKATYLDACQKVEVILGDLRLGKSLDVLSVKTVIRELTGSIFRNPDALKLLCVLQERNEKASSHALHVCVLTLAFAYYLDFKKEVIQQLGIGALLHDIGEIKLPQALFWKSSLYNDDEKNLVKKHVEYGVAIIKETNGLPPMVLDIVKDHHERLNGTGYPRQARGSEINYNAMLVAIVDVYDSVTKGYEGKTAISCTDALKSLYDWRDELFQGELIEHFIQCLGVYPIGSVVKLNSGEVGIVITFDDCSRLTPRVMLLLDKSRKQYDKPRILDLSRFRDSDDKFIYDIECVVNPDDYGIDIRRHILRELYVQNVVNQ